MRFAILSLCFAATVWASDDEVTEADIQQMRQDNLQYADELNTTVEKWKSAYDGAQGDPQKLDLLLKELAKERKAAQENVSD